MNKHIVGVPTCQVIEGCNVCLRMFQFKLIQQIIDKGRIGSVFLLAI